MDYATFRRFRDGLLEKRRPLRLDCMNPSKALAPWGPPPDVADCRRSDLGDLEALAVWSRVAGVPVEAAWVCEGVRGLLRGLVPALDGLVDEFCCPADVYPVYAEILGPRPRREYDTIPDVDWARLADASRRAALVCPIPLSPLGRYPDASEMRSLAAWLAESSERYVLVDAVYAYDFRTLVRVAAPLTDTGRAIVLFSCAKAWLMPSALGVAWASASLHAELRSRVTIRPSPKPSLASSWLAARPDLPGEQQRAFSREWRRLAPRIQAASPAWAPPETGYLSVVARPFEEILERYDVLAVPASVFGSSSRAHSVVSCLHDLVEHERAVR